MNRSIFGIETLSKAGTSSAGTVVGPGDRVTGRAFAGRSVVRAPSGMAACSQPLAAQSAVDVLRRGGHAVDAAIAANSVSAVTEPMSCGLGGDLFALVWIEKEKRLYGLNGSGRAPAFLDADTLADRGLKAVPATGPLSVTVPGVVDGWWELHRRFGTLPWSELFDQAADYAEQGFPVSDLAAHHWQEWGPRVSSEPGFAAYWLPDGRPPRAGERRRDPALARTYRRLAADGRDAFYEGEPAERMVRALAEAGAPWTRADFSYHTSSWVEPLSVSYRGHDIWQLPPNGQGLAVLQMLNILEGFDLRRLGLGSADLLHLQIEAKKLAFEDRARFYADPDFFDAPVEGLLSAEYAATRRSLIDPRRAAEALGAGTPAAGTPERRPPAADPSLLDQGDTVCIVTADGEGNMVSLMQSLFLPFGSGVTVPELGFVLQNRGALFAADPAHPNVAAPGKRPFHTIIPSFVSRDGEAEAAFGVMGGAAQPQGELQVLVHLLDFGLGLQEAGDAPRWLHQGSSQPTGRPADGGGTVYLESGFHPETRRGLVERGHRVAHTVGLFGGYQAVARDRSNQVYVGASEHRQDGQATGF